MRTMTCAWSATQCAFVMMRFPSTMNPEPVLSRCCFVCHGMNQLGLAATVYTLIMDPKDCRERAHSRPYQCGGLQGRRPRLPVARASGKTPLKVREPP